MMISLAHDQVRLLRLRAQRLIPQLREPAAGVAQLVKELCGIQAQDARAARYVAGIWKSQRKKNQLAVIVEPFDRLAPELYPGLAAEVADIVRFLDVQASLRVVSH